MKIYTSYYGNVKKLTALGLRPIGITLYPPKFLPHVPNYQDLAPTFNIFKKEEEEYTKLFNQKLKLLPIRKVIQDLESWGNVKPICLCCYEKPGEFCHRHLVADWLRKHGLEVEEVGQCEQKTEVKQLGMF